MFSKLKRNTARAAAVGAVAFGLTGVMAFEEAAPAAAAGPLLLIPIAGAVSGGAAAGTGAGITWGGVAALGATLGVSSMIWDLTKPGGFDLSGKLNDWFGQDKDPVTQEPKETVKESPVIAAPAWDSAHPDWVHAEPGMTMTFKEVRPGSSAGVANTLQATFHYGGPAPGVRLYVQRDGECMKADGSIRSFTSRTVGDVLRGDVAPSVTHSYFCGQGTASNPEKLISLRFRSSTSAEKTRDGNGADTAYYYQYRGPGQDYTWRAKDHPGYSQPGLLVTAQCQGPNGEPVSISEHIDRVEGGNTQLNIPSCAAAGLGPATSLAVGFADGDKIKQPLWFGTRNKDDFLQCDVALGQVCKLELFVDGLPCVMGSPACVSWVSLSKVNPGRVECRYGGKRVDISLCAPLEGAYVTGGTPAVQENTDGDERTWRVPATVPGWQPHRPGEEGEPEVDPNPDTEEPSQPDPEVDPEVPVVKPENPTDPEVDPETPVDPEPPVVNPETPPRGENGNCWAGKAAWNPVEWVYMPVSCALQDAFIPKVDITVRIDRIGTDLASKPPWSWAVTGIEPPSGDGCPNWVVNVGTVSKNIVCDSSFTAAIVGARGGIFSLLAAAMVWPLIRSLWYAAIPILRATPTGGK